MEDIKKILNSKIEPSDSGLVMILNKQLKNLLHQKDQTVAQVARATKISSKTIYSWLNGQSPRDMNQVKKVADHFAVSVDFLVFGIAPRSKTEFVDYQDEINAGVFEVILRKVKK